MTSTGSIKFARKHSVKFIVKVALRKSLRRPLGVRSNPREDYIRLSGDKKEE